MSCSAASGSTPQSQCQENPVLATCAGCNRFDDLEQLNCQHYICSKCKICEFFRKQPIVRSRSGMRSKTITHRTTCWYQYLSVQDLQSNHCDGDGSVDYSSSCFCGCHGGEAFQSLPATSRQGPRAKVTSRRAQGQGDAYAMK